MAGKRQQQAAEAFDELFPQSDVLSSVVANDRRRAGRGEQLPQQPGLPADEEQLGEKAYKLTSLQVGQEEVGADAANRPPLPSSETPPADGSTQPAPPKSTRKPQSRPAVPRAASAATVAARSSDDSSSLAARVEEASRLAQGRTNTVSFRMPHELNDWLDAYVHGAFPERVKKQDLIVEALRMLIARRGGPGQEIIPTALLGEDEP